MSNHQEKQNALNREQEHKKKNQIECLDRENTNTRIKLKG